MKSRTARQHGAEAPRSHSRVVPFGPSSSPLWLVTNEPYVNDLVGYLDAMRRRIEGAPDQTHIFEFSRARLA